MASAVSLTDITPTPSSIAAPSPGQILAKVIQEFDEWRTHKTNPAEAIPDPLWKKIFALAGTFPLAKLRAIFGVSAAQYNKKLQALSPPLSPSDPTLAIPPIELCEVKEATPLYQPQKLSHPPAMVVEFCRADGQIMKIHTTTDNFKTLMSLFFGKENPHAATLSNT